MAGWTHRVVRTVVAAVVVFAGSGCSEGETAASEEEPPVVVDEVEGSELLRLTLSEAAAERLDIHTSVVEASGDGFVVPRRAVVIDPTGAYWVYTSPEPLVFVRHELRRVREEGQLAYFGEGPDQGTAVVTTGVPELYGAEFGIGK